MKYLNDTGLTRLVNKIKTKFGQVEQKIDNNLFACSTLTATGADKFWTITSDTCSLGGAVGLLINPADYGTGVGVFNSPMYASIDSNGMYKGFDNNNKSVSELYLTLEYATSASTHPTITTVTKIIPIGTPANNSNITIMTVNGMTLSIAHLCASGKMFFNASGTMTSLIAIKSIRLELYSSSENPPFSKDFAISEKVSNLETACENTNKIVYNVSGSKSISSATWTNMYSVTLDPGQYLIYGHVSMSASPAGVMGAYIRSEKISDGNLGNQPLAGQNTRGIVSFCGFREVTQENYPQQLWAYQRTDSSAGSHTVYFRMVFMKL